MKYSFIFHGIIARFARTIIRCFMDESSIPILDNDFSLSNWIVASSFWEKQMVHIHPMRAQWGPRNSMLRSQLTISRGAAAAAMAQLLCQSLLHISLRRARTIKHGYHTRVMKPDAKKRFQRLNYLILNQLPIIGRTKRVTVKNSTFKNCKRQLCFLKKETWIRFCRGF